MITGQTKIAKTFGRHDNHHKEVLFFSTAHFLKTILASRTFAFAAFYFLMELAKAKEPNFPPHLII